MNDLRRDINEVFAKQQGQLGDAAGTGNRMLRAATAGRRPNRQLWPSVAGVALVLVAVTHAHCDSHRNSRPHPDVAAAACARYHTSDPLP